MQFLSVAERELRVAARKPSSFRVRMLTTGLALFMAGFAAFFGVKPLSGERLFFTLSWVTFLCAGLAGPALTADCVNEDRENGTLGLLFLTNLHPISVALGKLAGHGLLALYSIVSIFPGMALPALMGGTDAGSMAKTALVLLVTLTLSLILGMLTSTVCRKGWMAAALALLVLGILFFGIPLAATFVRFNQGVDWTWVELLSPSYALSMAGPTAAALPSNHLWLALGVQMAMACLFFGLVVCLLPRVWKEGLSGRKALSFQATWNVLRYGSGETRRRLRLGLLRMNPILWLSSRERFGPMGHAMLLLALAAAVGWTAQHVRIRPAQNDFLSAMMVWIGGMPLLYLCFCFRLASAASERFAVDRKAGTLDLILGTPLKIREVIRGHWLGLLRRFWGGALVLLGLHAFVLQYMMEAIRIETGLRQFDLGEVLVKAVGHVFGAPRIPNELAPFYVACLAVVAAAVLMVILWVALGWLGMALSLKLRREILAPWLSVLLLGAPPLPVFVGLVALMDNQKRFASNLFLGMLSFGMTGFLCVLTNALIWLVIARRWTYGKLRGATAAASCGASKH